jgi:malate synthase
VNLDGVEVRAPASERAGRILSDDALSFVARLHRALEPSRRDLLSRRRDRWESLRDRELPDLLPETSDVRAGDWRVPPAPPDLSDRRVEITGPVERKMMINALNSGARCFMADFEDANAPTWENCIDGQINLLDTAKRMLTFETPDKAYRLAERTATLLVRPRGWHLVEKHVTVDGEPVSASLFDAGLFAWYCAHTLLERGTGPYLYLPKLESHLEARLWNEAFVLIQEELGLPIGTIRATVLIETILAAFEMDEIMYELGPHATGLNAGRWDYIFSVIKKFGTRDGFVLPDRAQVTMAAPFMRAYTQLLVRTCHARGAHAIGGMAAFIPSRRDPEVNAVALARVTEDKQRESSDGFDGTWVAHPDLVQVATEIFDGVLGSAPNQLKRTPEGSPPSPSDLLDTRVAEGVVTEAGLRANVEVAIRYLDSWLGGVGAAAIHNLMEDAATAEIARSQVWQWLHHGTRLHEGERVTRALVERVLAEESAAVLDGPNMGNVARAERLVADTVFEDGFVEFVTIPAYEHLP